jgi:hypothetical protein
VCAHLPNTHAHLPAERLEQPLRLELGQAEAVHERRARARLEVGEVGDPVRLHSERHR